MEQEQNLDELLSCRLEFGRKAVEPCTIVIFGASGDLTARKLIPAFYHLYREKQLPAPFRLVGFARREKTDAAWRQELRAVRSPLAPKMTMVQGSTALRPNSRRQLNSSSRFCSCSISVKRWPTRSRLATPLPRALIP